ncbi:HNH endonuclease [Curtobacterium flaccumfaciens]|uniref:HNH endonuclease n=1 Tax=Curtobacterium flaccumfaciens TaxID=2035 RepID=UPI0035A8DCC0
MQGARERNPRKWCSEACRVKTYRALTPEYVERRRAAAASWHKATYVPTAHDIVCAVCGSDFSARRRDTKYCSSRCRFKAAYEGRRGRRAGVQRGKYTRRAIFQRDGGVCHLCLSVVDESLVYPNPMSFSIDHIVPLARGGADEEGNVRTSHLGCNWQKGARA